jgi:hypothetical protein
MHQEDDNYDYDDYDDSQDDPENKYKHYFKFDPEAWDAWGKMLYDALGNIVENSPNVWYIGTDFGAKSFPVSSYFSNAGKDKTFQYLGSNYQHSQVWKKKYFICDPLQHQYINHIQSHAVHFMKQPHYYKGLFDILN